MATYLSNAIAACESALDNKTEFALACQTLGNVLQSMGKFDEAIDWHTRALQVEPDLAEIYASLGRLYVEQQQWQDAIAAYEKVLSLKPNNTQAYLGIGEVYSNLGMQWEALDFWYQALTQEPKQATPEAHSDLGNLLFRVGKFEQAEVCYRLALELNSRSTEAHHNFGELLVQQGRWEEAIDCFRLATTQVPNPAWAYHRLGDALEKQGAIAEAIEAYQKSIECNPDIPWSYYNLIEALLKQEQWEAAITTSHAAIALNHNLPLAFNQLGRALAKTGKLAEAAACHRKTCELRGWYHCAEKGYEFTQDWFSHNIPCWEEYLKAFAQAPDLNALEIGSYEGMSACWLLDNVLTHPSARLTCIDLSFQSQFEDNLLKTGALEKVTPLVGNSLELLSTLVPHSYDVIYIDGCHLADYVQQDAQLSWILLKAEGIMIFDDYEWSDPQHPGQDPKIGVDTFLDSVQNEAEVLFKGYQVILKKVSA